MPTDDERREIAKNIRRGFDICSDTVGWFWLSGSLFGMSVLARNEDTIRSGINRLADLIEPTDGFDLDHMEQVCFECLEGCDEPEYTLYETILTAISRYKRGESGLPSAALVDRDALLALADEIETDGIDCYTVSTQYVLDDYARRIRKALGVEP